MAARKRHTRRVGATHRKRKKVGKVVHHRRRKVSGMDTGTMVLVGGVVLVGLYLMSKMSTATTPTVVVRTTTPSSSASTTAAEIAAGATVATTLVNDLTC